jgi:diadenosine tetraphosphate (Ap4A) HIT family hydrolase
VEEQMFTLDERLKNDTVELGDWPLCKVLLMKDAHYPWVILVPMREATRELFELSQSDQLQLMTESAKLLTLLKREFNGDKMNVANLGNVEEQLHIHYVVRYKTDVAWPKPVWGAFPAKPYSEAELDVRVKRLQAILFT